MRHPDAGSQVLLPTDEERKWGFQWMSTWARSARALDFARDDGHFHIVSVQVFCGFLRDRLSAVMVGVFQLFTPLISTFKFPDFS